MAPRLQTRRPSPNTVEYTLSTRPAPSPATTAFQLARLVLRLLLLVTAALLPLSRFPSSYSTTGVQHAFFSTAPGILLRRLAEQLPTPALLALAAALGYVSLCRAYTTESVLVLRGLGIQTRSSRGGLWGGDAARFIPTEMIRDVLVNEVFVGFEVRYSLVIIVDGEEEMVVVFPRLKPRKDVVLKVWRGIRGCLFEGGDGAKGKI